MVTVWPEMLIALTHFKVCNSTGMRLALSLALDNTTNK